MCIMHHDRLLLAFSALDYHSESLLAVLDMAVDARLQSMAPSQLATALWAMAKEEHVPSPTVLARAEEACIKGFRGFTPGQAAVVGVCAYMCACVTTAVHTCKVSIDFYQVDYRWIR